LLANFGKESNPTPINSSINQEPLAEIIGTTRSCVNSLLNKFRELGLISYNGNNLNPSIVAPCRALRKTLS
jgi:CRP/FNR family cyclic AMP-dependent transcriptional regulator